MIKSFIIIKLLISSISDATEQHAFTNKYIVISLILIDVYLETKYEPIIYVWNWLNP